MSGQSGARAEQPEADDLGFTWQITRDGLVLILRQGRRVAMVGGARARALAARIEAADPATRQQLMARASGNYARGNERAATSHPRNRTRGGAA